MPHTEGMCGQCRAPAPRNDWFLVGAGPDVGSRRRAREEAAQAASRVLQPWRISVRAPAASMTFMMTTATGKSRTVEHLEDLVDAAERLSGRPVDPMSAPSGPATESSSRQNGH